MDNFSSLWNIEYHISHRPKLKSMDTMLFVVTCGYFYLSVLQCDSYEAQGYEVAGFCAHVFTSGKSSMAKQQDY